MICWCTQLHGFLNFITKHQIWLKWLEIFNFPLHLSQFTYSVRKKKHLQQYLTVVESHAWICLAYPYFLNDLPSWPALRCTLSLKTQPNMYCPPFPSSKLHSQTQIHVQDLILTINNPLKLQPMSASMAPKIRL